MSPEEMLDLLDRMLVEDTRAAAMDALEDLLRKGSDDGRAVTYLIPVLHAPDDETRRRASWLIGKLAQNKACTFWPVEELNNLLHDDDPEVRENAAWCLGELTGMRIGSLGTIEHLNHLLGDESGSARGMAAWALGRMAERLNMGFQTSMAPLGKLLDDRYESVRRSAQYALDRLRAMGIEE
ncbi:MAG: HEAT repeat domain-containing protein [Methanomassiliicoccus sp.]|nr:HEAT repeat domain-containing protein [Methanomassiliicoccus sp.]